MIPVSWDGFASIETTPELLASPLRDVRARVGPLFAQARTAGNAGPFLDGLLGGEPRKAGWMRAEAAGDFWFVAAIGAAGRRGGGNCQGHTASGLQRLLAGDGTKGSRLYD